ncbi:MAG: hypothetical protein KA250_00045 [Verrucomicrobiales bacterium]|nr:hypothetical protein [Verrucomicrobiales bacterium]MBP9223595.1 hypothetical protein [Verrucomicrobiales bacterium]
MKIDTVAKLPLIAAISLFAACGESGKPSTEVTSGSPPHPAIASVLSETAPAGAISVVEARKIAKRGEEVTVEGIVAGTMSPFAEGFASVVVGDLAMETCDKDPGDKCSSPWDACCADPAALKEMRLTLQVSDAEGHPVAQSLKGIAGLAEMDRVIAVGTVAANSTAENLVINVSRLHRAPVR